MIACEKSNFLLVQYLCNSSYLKVNYYDKNRRNALFYLRGGNDDKQILELLLKKGIDVNWKDKDENTPFHFLALNMTKSKSKIDIIFN